MNDSLVILYSTGCPRCNVLKQRLDSRKIQYTIFDDVDAMLEKGISNVPMLEVEDKLMTYPEALKWLSEGDTMNV